jgi:hypothetical protein
MNYKEFIRKHKKIITLLAIGLGILLIVGIVLIIKNSKDNKVESPSTSMNSNATLKILNEKVSDNGRLIFLSFFDKDTVTINQDIYQDIYQDINQDIDQDIDQDKKYTFDEIFKQYKKNINALTENINFRKSIYHSLNRKDLEQTNDNFKLSSSPVLFTKAFFNNNHVYFPAKTFPFNEEDAKTYKDDKLENDGFDEEKALNLLQQAWDDLTPEQKQDNYKLNLFIQEDIKEQCLTNIKYLTNSILEQIQNLFNTFITKNHLPENKIKIQIVDKEINEKDPSQNMNMSLDIILPPIGEDKFKEEDYYWIISSVLNTGIGKKTITLNFSPLKIYLDKIKQQGDKIDTQFFSGLESETGSQYDKAYPGVDRQTGLFTSSYEEFLDFYDDVIFKLLPKGSNNAQEQQLIQQTHEEIFKKVLALIKDYRFHIPLVNYIATN